MTVLARASDLKTVRADFELIIANYMDVRKNEVVVVGQPSPAGGRPLSGERTNVCDEAQLFRERILSRLLRVVTNPLYKASPIKEITRSGSTATEATSNVPKA